MGEPRTHSTALQGARRFVVGSGIALFLAAIAAGCVVPEDVSPDVSVLVQAPSAILTVGDTVQLAAEVRRGEQVIVGALVAYTSSDSTVAFVSETGILWAVGVGAVDIEAHAVGFAAAETAELAFTVTRGIRIDSIITELGQDGGHTVHWGERAAIVGAGLDPAESVVFLGDAAVEVRSFVPGDASDPQSVDTLHVVMPAMVFGGERNLIAARLTGAGAGAQYPVTVVPFDVFEPNEDASTWLGSITAPLRRTNLALEVVASAFSPKDCASVWTNDRGECWSDWYSAGPTTDSVSLVFKFPRVLENTPVSIEIRWPGPQGSTRSALLSRNFSLCSDSYGGGFAFWVQSHEFAALRDSFVVALAGVSGRNLDFSATLWAVDQSPEVPWPGAPTGTLPYELQVLPTYASTLPADVAEENDFCHGAYELAEPADTLALTFDNGTDLDWFHFTVPDPGAPSPAVGSAQADVDESEPNDTPATADTIAIGDRVFAAFAEPSDIDYFAFYADSGAALEIETVTEQSDTFSMNTLVFLMNDDGIIAWNDDYSANNYDSRIFAVAPKSGWYVVHVLEKFLRGGSQYSYTLTLSPSAGQGQYFTAEVCCSTVPGEFNPQVHLLRDELRGFEGGIIPLEERSGGFTVPIVPGDYFLLVFNKAAEPVDYELQYEWGQGGTTAPIAPIDEVDAFVEEARTRPMPSVRRR